MRLIFANSHRFRDKSIYISICVSIYLRICLSIYQTIYLSIQRVYGMSHLYIGSTFCLASLMSRPYDHFMYWVDLVSPLSMGSVLSSIYPKGLQYVAFIYWVGLLSSFITESTILMYWVDLMSPLSMGSTLCRVVLLSGWPFVSKPFSPGSLEWHKNFFKARYHSILFCSTKKILVM